MVFVFWHNPVQLQISWGNGTGINVSTSSVSALRVCGKVEEGSGRTDGLWTGDDRGRGFT